MPLFLLNLFLRVSFVSGFAVLAAAPPVRRLRIRLKDGCCGVWGYCAPAACLADSAGAGPIALRLKFYDILHNFVALVLFGAFPLQHSAECRRVRMSCFGTGYRTRCQFGGDNFGVAVKGQNGQRPRDAPAPRLGGKRAADEMRHERRRGW